MDFGKLFTETSEQKSSPRSLVSEDLQSSRRKFYLEHFEGDLCFSV